MGNKNTCKLPPAKLAFNHKKNDFSHVCRFSGKKKRKIIITNQINLTDDPKDKYNYSPSQESNIMSNADTQASNTWNLLSRNSKDQDRDNSSSRQNTIEFYPLRKQTSIEYLTNSSSRDDNCTELFSSKSVRDLSAYSKANPTPNYCADMLIEESASNEGSSVVDMEIDMDRDIKFETFIEIEKLANVTKGRNNHSAENIRSSYFNKLIRRNLFGEFKPKLFNNIFIASWDDALFCTSYLSPKGELIPRNKMSDKVKKYLEKVEFSLVRLLSLAMSNDCDVYIFSDAKNGWIEESIMNYLPGVQQIINSYSCEKINLIYTKDYLENKKKVSNNYEINNARIEGVKSIFARYKEQSTLESFYNIICFSDSVHLIKNLSDAVQELKEGRNILADRSNYTSFLDKETNCYFKILKLKEAPEIEDLIKQQNLISDQFRAIYGAIRNVNIQVKVTPANKK